VSPKVQAALRKLPPLSDAQVMRIAALLNLAHARVQSKAVNGRLKAVGDDQQTG
jgi:hypothetical protein